MKTTITKTITPAVTKEVEIEIALPFYSKDSSGIYYMIRTDESIIRVINFSDTFCKENAINYYGKGGISIQSTLPIASGGFIISREEFFEQYNKAMNKIVESQIAELSLQEENAAALSQDTK